MPTELHGQAAIEKAEGLKEISVDNVNWTVLLVDDATDEEWIMDYPESEYHGGGPPRLTLIEER